MATLAQLQLQLSDLRAQRNTVQQQISQIEAEKENLVTQRRRQRAGGDEQGAQFLTGLIEQTEARQGVLEAKSSSIGDQIYSLETQITEQQSSAGASGGTATTAATQGAASAANPANADTAAGGSPTPGIALGTPGATTVTAIPSSPGADPQVDPRTPAQIAQDDARIAAAGALSPSGIANPNNSVTNAGSNQTAGSNDDAGPTVAQNIRASAQSISNSQSAPLPNPLDKYPNYTYNLGLYLLSPEDYNEFVEAPSIDEFISLPGDQLLIRSGGGPIGAGNRNSYFSDCDFNLDNLRIESVIGFSEQGIPSSVGRLSFTVTEPLGATFIYRLQSAVTELANKNPSNSSQYFTSTYALVIRFYGYDDKGQIVSPEAGINQLSQPGSGESAVITKIFHFMLSDIKTRIGTRIVEYQIQGIYTSNIAARTAMLGVSPAPFSVTGANLDDIFNGVPGSTNTSTSADDPRAESTQAAAADPNQTDAETRRLQRQNAAAAKASGQSSQSIPVRGLCQAINNTLKELANPNKQNVKSIEIPDEYEVLFASEKLRSAKVLIAEVDNGLQNSAGSVTTGSASTKAENTRKNTSVSKYAKNFPILQGQSIIQWLDFMVRNCDYIKNQAAFTIKESADADIQGDEDFYGKKLTSQTPVRWYKITAFSKILGHDRLRKTYAQKIIYVISDYEVISARSPYFKRAPWRGPDKLYNFTFTGQNTAILNYEQEFNALYIETFGFGASLNLDPAKQIAAASGQVGPSYAFRVVAGAGKQGSLGQSTDPAARAAAGLYSFTDLAKVKLNIVGDPDLLLQDWYNVNQALINRQNLILNSNHGQLYFQVTFLTGDDYDPSSGIVKLEPRLGYVRRQSNAYELTKIISEFKNGKFTQDIHGLLLADVDPDEAYIEGDYTSSGAGSTAPGRADQVTDIDSSTARQETTQASQETGAFDTDGSNDLRTQEGGSSSVPQSPTSALPATAPPTFAQRQVAASEVMRQAYRDQFRRKLLPNQAQTGNDDAPGISDIIAP
jgi:hypothetical protein